MSKKIKVVRRDLEIVPAITKGDGNFYHVRFTSMGGYEIIWTKEEAEQIVKQIVESSKNC